MKQHWQSFVFAGNVYLLNQPHAENKYRQIIFVTVFFIIFFPCLFCSLILFLFAKETTKSDRKVLKAEKKVKNDVDALKFDGEALQMR